MGKITNILSVIFLLNTFLFSQITQWDSTNCILALPFYQWALGNGTDQNTGQMPSYPDSAYQNITFTNMTSGFGFLKDSLLCRFDGSDDYIQLGDPVISLSNTSQFTVEVWIDYSGTNGQYMFGTYDDGNNLLNCAFDADKPFLFIKVGGTLSRKIANFSLFNGLRHIVYVKDGANLRIYIDGHEKAYSLSETYSSGNKTFSNNAFVSSFDKASSWFDSDLYWLAVYDTAFDAGRALSEYNLGVHKKLQGNSTGKDMVLSDSLPSQWDETNCVVAMPFSSWSLGNGFDNQNTGQMPTFPDSASQDADFTNMAAGYGYDRDSGACLFDGVDDHIQLGDSVINLSNTSEHTIEYWIEYVGNGTYQTIFTTGDDGSNHLWSALSNTNGLATNYYVGGTLNDCWSNDPISNGLNYVVHTKKGADLRLYLNGHEVNYFVDDDYTLGSKTFTTDAQVGAYFSTLYHNSNDLYWFAVYDTAIDSARIFNNYMLGKDMGKSASNLGKDMILQEIGTTEDYADWTYSKACTLNTVSAGITDGDSIVNFPILIRLNSTNFDFDQAKSDGGDIRFAKSDGTHLHYEIERFDGGTPDSAEIWVETDTIYVNDATQYITMYWGNSSAGDSSNPHAVFDTTNGFVGVWHLGEGSGTSTADASVNAHTLTLSGTQQWSGGRVGNAFDFDDDGGDDYFYGSDANSLDLKGNAASTSAWVNMEDNTGYRAVVSKNVDEWEMNINGGSTRFECRVTGPSYFRAGTATSDVTTGSWFHVAAVRNGSTISFYVNGVKKTTSYNDSQTANDFWTGTSDINIGRRASGGLAFDGIIDEVRVVNDVRDSNWIKLCYENQKDSQALVGFGLTVSTPTIDSVVSDSGLVDGGETVKVYGTYFGGSQGSGFVKFGDSTQTISEWTDDSITVTTTAYHTANAVDVIAQNDAGLADTLSNGFTYYQVIEPSTGGNLRKKKYFRWMESWLQFSRRRLRR